MTVGDLVGHSPFIDATGARAGAQLAVIVAV